ncbi:MAG: hypothetical protein ACU0DI_14410, partial [Paracoccaceae bacterium]
MAKNDINIPYVEPHGNARRYRRFVPADVRDKIGRKRWIKTFPKDTPLSLIEQRAKKLALAHDSEIAIARGGELSPDLIAHLEKELHEMISKESDADIMRFRTLFAQGEEDLDPPSPVALAMQNIFEND